MIYCEICPVGFVRCQLDMTASLAVITTLHVVQGLGTYTKAFPNAAAGIWMWRLALGEGEKTFSHHFSLKCKRGPKIAKEPLPRTEAELKADNTVLHLEKCTGRGGQSAAGHVPAASGFQTEPTRCRTQVRRLVCDSVGPETAITSSHECQ